MLEHPFNVLDNLRTELFPDGLEVPGIAEIFLKNIRKDVKEMKLVNRLNNRSNYPKL